MVVFKFPGYARMKLVGSVLFSSSLIGLTMISTLFFFDETGYYYREHIILLNERVSLSTIPDFLLVKLRKAFL